MFDKVALTVGVLPDKLLADAGYFSEEQIVQLQEKFPSVNFLVPPNRQEHSHTALATRGPIPKNISTADRMRRKLRTKEGKAAYGHRKTIVEPVFGQIKSANLDFEQFSFRSLEKVQCEWSIVCSVHNLLKIYRHRKKALSPQLRAAA
jgi:hypothetical protein